MVKIVVLGLDGGTWRVFDPLIKAGFLPNFRRVLEDGSSGFLKSTIPPVTSPAWPSMVTGLNPGKLGVYSTLVRGKAEIFSLRHVTSSIYKGKALWDFLSASRFRVALFKIPFLYPVYKTNGCMVSGFGSASKLAAYPKYLHKKLVSGPSSLLEGELFKSLETLNRQDEESCVQFVEKLKFLVQKESRVILELLRTLEWDFMFYVVSPLDWLQHAFMDRIIRLVNAILSNNSSEQDELDKVILDFYKYLDVLTGQLLKLVEQSTCGEDFVFFIVSDHGFTIRPYTFNLARWLIRNNYMKIYQPDKYGRSLKSILLRKVSNVSRGAVTGQVLEGVLEVLPAATLRVLKKIRRGVAHKHTISEYIDFERSKVFCLEDRGVYLNPSVKGERILDEMIDELDRFLKRFDADLNLKVYTREEIYWGDKVQLSPDLLVKIHANDKIWEISTNPMKPLIFKPSLPGIHDDWGVFCVYGPQIRKRNSLSRILLWDVCPTILHIFDVPIPPNMDGKVLKGLFVEGSEISKRAINYCKRKENKTREEKERIKQRLKSLRYV